MDTGDAGACTSGRELMPDDGRFHCPFPDCSRSFAELWRLKVHYRAPPDVRGSGKERGHGIELTVCPKCWTTLKPGKHHVGCSSGKTTQRKKIRQSASGHFFQAADGSLQQAFGMAFQHQFNPMQMQMQMQLQMQQQQWTQQAWQQHQQQQQMQMLAQNEASGPGPASPMGYHPAGVFPMAPFHPGLGAQQQFAPAYQMMLGQQQQQQQQQSAFAGMPAFSVSGVPQQVMQPMQHAMSQQMVQQVCSVPQQAMQQASSMPEQTSARPREAAGCLGSMFDDDDEFNYVPAIPSPPHLPNDFGASGEHQPPDAPARDSSPPGCGVLFNFGQFAQRMPSQGSLEAKHGGPDNTVAALTRGDLPADNNVLAHDDGDIVHLLFGLPDELPTMSTIHVHKWISRDGHSSNGGKCPGEATADAAHGYKAHEAGACGAKPAASFAMMGALEQVTQQQPGQEPPLQHKCFGDAGGDPHSSTSPDAMSGETISSCHHQAEHQNGCVVHTLACASASGKLGTTAAADGLAMSKRRVAVKEEDLPMNSDASNTILLDHEDHGLTVPWHSHQMHLDDNAFVLDTVPRTGGLLCLDELQLFASAE